MATLNEPIEIDIDLSSANPFPSRLSKKRRERVSDEIKRLRQQLGLIASAATRTKRGSPIDQRFEELRKKEHFEHPIKGIEILSYKLQVDLIPRNDRQRRNTLYALLRLRIAQRVVELVRNEGVLVNFTVPLALHKKEGDLDVPMSLERLDDGFAPPGLTADPYGDIDDLFMGPHHTFFVQKQGRPIPKLETFVREVQLAVTTHDLMKRSLANNRKFNGHMAYQWLESGKKGAMSMYMLILGGLDMYAQGIFEPPGVFDRQLQDFSYPYARNRLFIDPSRSFSDELSKGIKAYQAFTMVTLDKFMNGQIEDQAIVATVHERKRGERLHHFLPNEPVEFGAAIGMESVMTLEALRRAPLINGGPRFDDPLPYGVAYIRYNAGDIYFLVILLNLWRIQL